MGGAGLPDVRRARGCHRKRRAPRADAGVHASGRSTPRVRSVWRSAGWRRAWYLVCADVGRSRVSSTTRHSRALIGATIIDGNAGPPVPDGAIVIDGDRITAAGARDSVAIPSDADVIDATGAFILPGLIDTNAHLTVYGVDAAAGYETLVRYGPRNVDLAIEGAQRHLKCGVTTVRDSYGVLPALCEARAAIEARSVVGARILAAG